MAPNTVKFVRVLAGAVLCIALLLLILPAYYQYDSHYALDCGSVLFKQERLGIDVCAPVLMHRTMAAAVMGITAIGVIVGLRKEKDS